MASLTERVERVEDIIKEIATLQLQTQRSLNRLSKQSEKTEKALEEFKQNTNEWLERLSKQSEKTDRALESLSKQSEKTEKALEEFKQNTNEWLERLSKQSEKTDRALESLSKQSEKTEKALESLGQYLQRSKEEMDRKWGELANSLGIVVEAIVGPGFPDMLKKYFNCEEFERIMVDITVRKPSNKQYIREFDLVAVCKDMVFINETKTQIRREDIKKFKEFIDSGEFFEYFPEYKGKVLIPVMSSLRIKDDILSELTKNKIFAVSLEHSDLQVLNHKKVAKYYPILKS